MILPAQNEAPFRFDDDILITCAATKGNKIGNIDLLFLDVRTIFMIDSSANSIAFDCRQNSSVFKLFNDSKDNNSSDDDDRCFRLEVMIYKTKQAMKSSRGCPLRS